MQDRTEKDQQRDNELVVREAGNKTTDKEDKREARDWYRKVSVGWMQRGEGRVNGGSELEGRKGIEGVC